MVIGLKQRLLKDAVINSARSRLRSGGTDCKALSPPMADTLDKKSNAASCPPDPRPKRVAVKSCPRFTEIPGVVVPATTCVIRCAIITISPATRSVEN